MPFQVKCGNCGAILYESPNDIPGIAYLTRRNNQKLGYRFSPITLFIRTKIGTHCPKCGERLANVPRTVKVIPVIKET